VRQRRLLLIVLAAAAGLSVLQVWLRRAGPARDPTRDYSCLRSNPWGTKALRELCARLGWQTKVWRQSFAHLPPPPAVLCVLAPAQPLAHEELRALEQWVHSGGQLVIAVRQAPWVRLGEDKAVLDSNHLLLAWLGLAMAPPRRAARSCVVEGNPWPSYRIRKLALGEPAQVVRLRDQAALRRYLRAQGVAAEALRALPAAAPAQLVGRLATDAGVLGLSLRLGRGRIAVLADVHMLSNGWIGQADNALLAAAVIFPAGAPQVLFDEYHHGLGWPARGAPSRAQRVAAASVNLLLVALGVYLLPAVVVRMGRARVWRGRARRSLGEYVRAVAWLYQRAQLRSAALLVLGRAVRRAWAVRLGLAADAPPAAFAQAAAQRRLPAARRLAEVLTSLQQVQQAHPLSNEQFLRLARELITLQRELARHE
jgi:hypothetical protein